MRPRGPCSHSTNTDGAPTWGVSCPRWESGQEGEAGRPGSDGSLAQGRPWGWADAARGLSPSSWRPGGGSHTQGRTQSPWLGLQSPGRGRRMEVGGNILGRADLMDSVWQGLGHWYDHGLLSPIAPPARAAWATVRTSRRTQVHVLGPFGVCEGSQGALQRRGG